MLRKMAAGSLIVLVGGLVMACGTADRLAAGKPPRFLVRDGATAVLPDELGRAEVVLPDGGEAMFALLPTTEKPGSYPYAVRASAAMASAGEEPPAEVTAAAAPARVEAPPAYRALSLAPGADVAMPDERDFQAPAGRGKSGYVKVHAYKLAEGDHSVFYAEESNDMVLALGAQVVDYVDRIALPEETAMFGPVPDIDANGKLILLATAAVNGYSSIPGEFTGGFFAAKDLDGRPGSNGADMLYLYLPRPVDAGGVYDHADDYLNLLEEVVVHEIQHMINYAARLSARSGLETAWLNEGLSHYAEEHFGFQRSNAIRSGYFLASPETTPLTGNCETLAERGAAFLFVKYLAESSGDPLVLRKLVQSGLQGAENVERAVGRPFGAVLRSWSAALWRGHRDDLKTERWSAGVTSASLPQAAPAFLHIKGPVTLTLASAPGGAFQGSVWRVK